MRRRVRQLTVPVSVVIVHWVTYTILICVQPDKIDGALAKYFGAAAEIPNDAGLLITCFVNVVSCQWRIRPPVHVGDACCVWQVRSCRHRLPQWCLVPNVVCRCHCVLRKMEKGWLTSLYWNNERINSCLHSTDWRLLCIATILAVWVIRRVRTLCGSMIVFTKQPWPLNNARRYFARLPLATNCIIRC